MDGADHLSQTMRRLVHQNSEMVKLDIYNFLHKLRVIFAFCAAAPSITSASTNSPQCDLCGNTNPIVVCGECMEQVTSRANWQTKMSNFQSWLHLQKAFMHAKYLNPECPSDRKVIYFLAKLSTCDGFTLWINGLLTHWQWWL